MVSIDNSLSHQSLRQLIVEEMMHSKSHSIPFSRFMEMALFSANVGYYQTTQYLLGKQGDFTTAPEISSWFSYCIANYCLSILKSLPLHTSSIMEIGPGTARMAADILLALEKLNCLPSRYILVEISDCLRKQQQLYLKQRIPHLADRIEYRTTLPKEPIVGIILANEVMDVLPVHRFGIEKGNLYEYYVGSNAKQFVWQKLPPTASVQDYLKQIQQDYLIGVNDYTSEVRLSLDNWFASVEACLSKGCMILIDYGKPAREYYHPMRYMGTLRCYYRHRLNSEPLERVGLQDITSEVDFTQVANLAVRANLELKTFTTQTAFLLASGLLDAFESSDSDAMYLKKKGEIYQLISPLEMGELCKVMVLGRKLCCDLSSFEAYDRRFTL